MNGKSDNFTTERKIFKVVEIFTSINGESKNCGKVATFVRFAGCNLNCSYCDTKWANEKNVKYKMMSAMDIYEAIKKSGAKYVTLTGGEPLKREGISQLIDLILYDKQLFVEIETNGSISIADMKKAGMEHNRLSFTLDYKCPDSKMEKYMLLDNFNYVGKNDAVKFVVSSMLDLKKTKLIIEEYELNKKTNVYISPVFWEINPQEIVEFMKKECEEAVKEGTYSAFSNINMQLQLHKFIWDPNERGV